MKNTYPKQIQKFAGLEIVKKSSGKKKGQPRISKRGRRKLRRTMYGSAHALINWNSALQECIEPEMTQFSPIIKCRVIVITL